MKYLGKVKWEMTGAMLLLVASTVLNLIAPRISGQVIDILNENYGVNRAVSMVGMIATFVGTAFLTDKLAQSHSSSESMVSLSLKGMAVGLLALVGGGGMAAAAANSTTALRDTVLLMFLLFLGSGLCSLGAIAAAGERGAARGAHHPCGSVPALAKAPFALFRFKRMAS